MPRRLLELRRLASDRETRRLIVFLLVGGLNTAVNYVFFVTMIALGLSPTLAVIAATALGIIFNFFSTGRIVFQSGNLGTLPRFIVVYAVQCLLNVLLLRSAAALGANLLLAQAAILFTLAIGTFFAMRRFVFGAKARS